MNDELTMKPIRKKLPDISLVLFSILLLIALSVEGLDLVASVVISYFVFTFLRFINNLGHTIDFFDFLTFYSALDTLISPLITYRYSGKDYRLSAIWGAYMRVPEDVYFSYLIPANLALFAGLHLVLNKNVRNVRQYVEKAREYASGKLKVGIWFMVIGLTAGQLTNVVPGTLTFVFYLLAMLSYVGGFYIYFSVKKFRTLVILALVLIFFVQAARSGLFGEFAMFVVLAGCLVVSQYQISFFAKLTFFVVAFTLMLVVQSSKLEYRAIIWSTRHFSKEQYREKGNLEILSDLVSAKLANPNQIFSREGIFYLNRRFNQGWLISMAMNYVPRVEPFANGETIWLSLAAVVAPRFLWPDKPEAGGYLNLSRFVGIKKRHSYSMNIGPYGEAYGNFGVVGGVIFIFLYGVLLAWFLDKALEKSKKYPSLIIWMPLLFYYVLTVETDILTTINSFIKIVVFILIVYWLCKKLFKLEI